MLQSVEVLIVEDFEPFRRFIISILERIGDMCVVGEVADGREAVKEAKELQPDLILLDIGLPGMSGLDAAREIRKLAPKSKIIFVSQESSADIIEEALALGAAGYVVKQRAARDLLTTVASAGLLISPI